jgi:iron-sulfur cluster assembly protein
MLQITKNAGQAIQALVRNNGLPEQAGLRIDAPDKPPAPSVSAAPLQLTLAPELAEGDQVVEGNGAKVFVSPRVAAAAADMILDARASGEKVKFVLKPRQADQDLTS